jgi:hypothetical protein
MHTVSYGLHSLGWKAFQDLCSTIVREVMGHHAQQFFDSKDGGRDGAFCGTWQPQNGTPLTGESTIQCKFSAKPHKHLALSDLSDEIEKAKRLAANGLADNYILMTSMHITGEAEEDITRTFQAIRGIRKVLVYGNEWISNVIRETPKLRMLVPRVYGLGDLSQIMDERAATQASEILSSMGDDLSKFVITDSHRQSVRALKTHGFVLLLGEPASGKSTIAASLAIAAIDNWGQTAFKIRNAEDFVRHSNPHETNQLFWVDDAFGATQLDYVTTLGWNSVLPHMSAAIKRGASVIFTSRDYIFRSARDFLKESAFPLLRESQVIIDVQQLSMIERSQILYNHIRLGRQPREIRSRLKPYLENVAANTDFKPEVARRLGDPLFTQNLTISRDGLRDFVEKPMEHLCEVIRTLDSGSKSALAVIFMRGGSISSPLNLTDEELRAAELLGGNTAAIRSALNALNESLVLSVRENGSQVWRFKHPTVRDAFAENIANDSELLDVYLAGSTTDRLLNEVACGTPDLQGVRVTVPKNRYTVVLDQFLTINLTDHSSRSRLLHFLRYRCDGEFVRAYLDRHPDFIDSLRFGSYIAAVPDMELIVRLHELHLLPEENRVSVVRRIGDLAVETPDAGFLNDRFRSLLRNDELKAILQRVRDELITELPEVIDSWRSNYCHERDKDPEAYFELLKDTLTSYQRVFGDVPNIVEQLTTALAEIERTVQSLAEDLPYEDDFYDDDERSVGGCTVVYRSIFDDVDE